MIKLINLRRVFLYLRGRVKHLAIITIVGGLLGAGVGLALFSRTYSQQPLIYSDYFFSASQTGDTPSTPSADAIAFLAGSYFLTQVAEDVFPNESSAEMIGLLGIRSSDVGEESTKGDVLARAVWLSAQGPSTFKIQVGSLEEALNQRIGDSIVRQIEKSPMDAEGGLRVKLLSVSVSNGKLGARGNLLQYVGRYGAIGLAFGFSVTLCVLLFLYVFSKTVYAKEDFSAFSDVPETIVDDHAQSDEYVAEACYSVLPDSPKIIGVSSTAGDEVASAYAKTMCDALSRGGHDAGLWTPTDEGLEGLIDFAHEHDIVVVPVANLTVDPLVFRIGRGIQGLVMAERIRESDLLLFDRALATLKGQHIPVLRVVLR